MKVRWTEYASAASVELADTWCAGEEINLDHERIGEVIGSTKNVWGQTFLTVACDDGIIREVRMEQAKTLPPETK